MNRDKIKKIIGDSVTLISALLFLIGEIMFLVLSDGVFFSTAGFGAILVIIWLLLPIGYIAINLRKPKFVDNRYHRWIAIASLVVAIIMLASTIIATQIVDIFQPLVLVSTANVLLIVSAVLLLVSALLELIFDDSRVSTVISVMLIATLFTGILWANVDGDKKYNDEVISEKGLVFENGDKGYSTFRIPSIITLDKDILAKDGLKFDNDLVLAMAEGRRDSSRDTGSVDMVAKVSKDMGKTWGEMQVLLSYKDEVGKYGNPTPVLARNGEIVLPYMTATKANNYDYDTYIATLSIDNDGMLKVETNENVSFKKTDSAGGGSDGVRAHTLMMGPGKSIQLSDGRIVIPASSGGHSFAIYKDESDTSWTIGESAGEGNECEIVDMGDELVMVVRDNIGCCGNHFKQYQRLSYSKDGGETWYKKTVDTTLRSPICMSSIAKLSDGTMLLSYPDSFYTRVRLSIATSKDNGTTFKTTRLYDGPTGYSCMTVDRDDNIYILAEVGAIDYNEKLIMMKINNNKLRE